MHPRRHSSTASISSAYTSPGNDCSSTRVLRASFCAHSHTTPTPTPGVRRRLHSLYCLRRLLLPLRRVQSRAAHRGVCSAGRLSVASQYTSAAAHLAIGISVLQHTKAREQPQSLTNHDSQAPRVSDENARERTPLARARCLRSDTQYGYKRTTHAPAQRGRWPQSTLSRPPSPPPARTCAPTPAAPPPCALSVPSGTPPGSASTAPLP